MIFEKVDTKYGTILIPDPVSYRDCYRLILSDKCRVGGSFLSILYGLIRGNLLSWFRLCQKKDIWSPIKNRIYLRIAAKRKIDLPVTTKVGYGLYLGHSMCMVINGKSVIGNNVNLSQFLNIGSNNGKPAVICDNVYIAPMVCLVEDVVIGENSRIGAGAVVTKDVPNNCTVAGVPAKIISNKSNTPIRPYIFK